MVKLKSSSVEELKKKLVIAMDVFSDERVRWFIGKSKELTESGLIKKEDLDEIIHSLIQDEAERHLILRELEEKEEGLTVSEIASLTRLPSEKVNQHLEVLRFLGKVSMTLEKEGRPMYTLSPIKEERRACPCEALVMRLLRSIAQKGAQSS